MRLAILATLLMSALASQASAFCGFYVGRAKADLFNEASKVVYARKDETSVITMVSDYQGPLSEFAMVVPVPKILEESDVRLASMAAIDHLDSYTAPRLVEYTDPNPCQQQIMERSLMMQAAPMAAMQAPSMAFAEDMGVTIERTYSVGEYDILILSAEQAEGLTSWLNAEGYQIPPKATPVVKEYLRMGMKFFVAKINLPQASSGKVDLNPLQIQFDSPDFMLPIRLGMANAKPDAEQDLIAYFLTDEGQVDLLTYPLTKIPSNIDIPVETESIFDVFYKRTFAKANADRAYPTAFLEYAWDMSWCDPCAADPLSNDQLRDLGAFWIKEPKSLITEAEEAQILKFAPQDQQLIRQTLIQNRGGFRPQMARNAFVTRMHMRYSEASHPHDLMMSVTNNKENFQGRYVMRHAATLSDEEKTQQCGQDYLIKRLNYEARTKARFTELTGMAFASAP